METSKKNQMKRWKQRNEWKFKLYQLGEKKKLYDEYIVKKKVKITREKMKKKCNDQKLKKVEYVKTVDAKKKKKKKKLKESSLKMWKNYDNKKKM